MGSPGKSPASSSSFLVQQQQSATIASLQEERTELRRALSRLQGQISDLEEGRAQDKVCGCGERVVAASTCIVSVPDWKRSALGLVWIWDRDYYYL